MDINQACEAFRILLEEQQNRIANMNTEKTDFTTRSASPSASSTATASVPTSPPTPPAFWKSSWPTRSPRAPSS